MVSIVCSGIARILLAAAIIAATALPCTAADFYWGRHPDKERVVFTFSSTIPSASFTRTGRTQVSVTLPPDYMTGEQKPQPQDFPNAELVQSVRPLENGFLVELKDPAFGYIHFALGGQNKLVLDIFPDSFGARWKPNNTAETEPEPEPETTEPEQQAQAPKTEQVQAASEQQQDLEIQPRAQIQQPPEQQPRDEQAEAPRTGIQRAAVTQPLQIRPRNPQAQPPDTGLQQGAAPESEEQQQTEQAADAGESDGDRPFYSVSNTVRQPVSFDIPRSAEPSPSQIGNNTRSGQASGQINLPTGTSNATPAESGGVKGQISRRPTQSDSRQQVQTQPLDTETVEAESQAGPPDIEDVRSNTVMTEPPPEGATPEEQVAGQTADQTTEQIADQPADTQKEPTLEEIAAAEDAAQAEQAQEEQGMDITQRDEAAVPEQETDFDFEAAMLAARVSLNNEDYEAALEAFTNLRKHPQLPDRYMEEIQYSIADIEYALHRDELENYHDRIVGEYTAAMHLNPDSLRVPAALLRIGLIHMKVGNIREADAYFNILKQKYPYDENIPLIYYYWGDYYYKNEEYQKAADQFQYVVQKYPDNKFVREASEGLARALYRLGYDRQAYQIVDYIEKRWPRFYVEYPPFLRLMGDVSYRLQDYDRAKVNYWTYYNLDPDGQDMDMVLARLGDIYSQSGHRDAASQVYDKTIQEFPDKEGSLISQMRLAEEGIYDEPTISDMFSIFDRPFSLKPVQIYKIITQEHPDSDLAPLAQLKLAMWYLWNKQYPESIDSVADFYNTYPDHELLDRAKEVGLTSFDELASVLVTEENYKRIVDLWSRFDIIRAQEEELSPKARISVALSYSKTGEPDKAVQLIEPFFKQSNSSEYSTMALHLALSIYLENQAWSRIIDLADQIQLWVLEPPSRREMDFALALAYENLNRPEDSRPIWTKLAANKELDETQKAYTMYFLALEAKEKALFEEAYEHAQDALSLLLKSDEDKEKIRDMLSLLVDVTETSGRVQEALKWAGDYSQYLTKNDAEWPALRYRMARLYKKLQETAKWRTILEDLSTNNPESLYGRMAASELNSIQLEEDVQEYIPSAGI